MEEQLRGTTFTRWEQVPAYLMTKTKLAEYGLRPQGPAFASIRYYAHKTWRRYDLYAVAETRPVRAKSDDARAAQAAKSVFRSAGRFDDAIVL